MKTPWVDFKAVKESLDFVEVLGMYGIKMKRRRNQLLGFCPLPGHTGVKLSASFSANIEKGIFRCFGCGAQGNVLEFAAFMEKADPKDGKQLRSIVLKLREHLALKEKAVPEPGAQSELKMNAELPTVVNVPLDFELKGLNQDHPYLHGRGFSIATIVTFGLGMALRGLLKGRLAIPLEDQDGKLIGYAGRVIDDSTISEENPKYIFPAKRERNGTLYEFRKSLILYNGFRIKGPVEDIIVVTGFASAWWLHQCGFPHVVATMDSDCSDRQAELIISLVSPDGRIWIVPDGNEAGEGFASVLLFKMSPHRFVRWIRLDADDQPTDMSAEYLRKCFTI